jgi:hypothetical protein
MPTPRPLYRRSDVAGADAVFVTEGEKCAVALRSLGHTAVTSAGGASAAKLTDWSPLAGKTVVILPDHDEPGRKYAADVVKQLGALSPAPNVRVVNPPGLSAGGDIADWLEARSGTPAEAVKAEFDALVASAEHIDPPGSSPRMPAVPEYVPFPVECLPEAVQPFVRAVAAATNTDPTFTALPLLSLLGVMVGTARAVTPNKKGWRVFPTVWACTVGRSSSGKSPPLAAVNDALAPMVDELNDSNEAERMEYERVKAERFGDRTKRGHPPPAAPAPRRLRVSDTTVEALAGVLHHNPRGVWLVADELAGWFGGFTRYKSGGENTDRPKWLALFDSGFLEVDRKTGEPKHISVRNTMVGVAGGIQPQILKAAMTDENLSSGLFARILVAYPPDRLAEWSEAEVADETTAALTDVLRQLRQYQPTERDGRLVPGLNTLSPDAKAVYVAFFNANRRRAFTADDAEAAAAVKLEAYALRFAHLRHLCRCAGGDDSAPVSADDMAAGIRLAEWFVGELQRVRTLLAEPERMSGQRRLVCWIRTAKGGSVSPRDLQRSDARRYPDTAAACNRLEQLAADGFGEWTEERAANGRAVERFVLYPDPIPDARHYPTLLPPAGNPASDTTPEGVTDNPGISGMSGEVSGSVKRRVGHPQKPPSPPTGDPVRGEVSGVPTGPVWEDWEQFYALMTSRGKTWPDVLRLLNAPPTAGFFAVPSDERRRAVRYLERLHAVAPRTEM